ncbi:MAG: pyrroline-5-carboxylate reductase [Candidatus Omnitrophica bacterium]|nr:pyrroline-5-carboxylate reductase [Candidatus Omnitrophota bacterium]
MVLYPTLFTPQNVPRDGVRWYMRTKFSFGILGFGNMGKALGTAAAAESSRKIQVYDTRASVLKPLRTHPKLKRQFRVCGSAAELFTHAEAVVLAVKPQDLRAVLRAESGCILERKPLLISIAAGIPLSLFTRELPGVRVVRAMPNLPAQVRNSVTFLCAGRHARKKDMECARRLFSAAGEVWVMRESLLDSVTAVSGSGPGYVFYFMHCMYEEAVRMGMTRAQARRTVLETFLGAGRLAKASGTQFDRLVAQVASPKGTTEAAFAEFRKGKLKDTIQRGIRRAAARAAELSRVYTKERA